MPKRIRGTVKNNEGVTLPGVIVVPGTYFPDTEYTQAASVQTTDNEGNFEITVDNRETKLSFFTSFLASGLPSTEFTIPTPVPAYWNVILNQTGPVISSGQNVTTPGNKKMNWWPVYAGAGLLALLLIRKMSKKKKRK